MTPPTGHPPRARTRPPLGRSDGVPVKATVGLTGPQRLVVRLVGRFPGITAGRLAEILHVHCSGPFPGCRRRDWRLPRNYSPCWPRSWTKTTRLEGTPVSWSVYRPLIQRQSGPRRHQAFLSGREQSHPGSCGAQTLSAGQRARWIGGHPGDSTAFRHSGCHLEYRGSLRSAREFPDDHFHITFVDQSLMVLNERRGRPER